MSARNSSRWTLRPRQRRLAMEVLEDRRLLSIGLSGSSTAGLSAQSVGNSPVAAQYSTAPTAINPLVQQAKLTASDGASSDQFGQSVSISGNTVVVGAPGATVGGNWCQGAVYVFTTTGSGWAQIAELTASDGAASARFGRSVSISGNTVVATGGLAAYVFTEPASGWANMTETAKLTASDGEANTYFGCSVSISGNTVVVGASYATVGGNTMQGAAYVFTEPGSGWANMTQTAKLTASDGAAYDAFGSSVAISGKTVVVGAPGLGVPGKARCWAAYVFTEPDAGWADVAQAAKLTASDGPAFYYFGESVSISGNTVVVGESPDGNATVYVFTEPGSGWRDMTQTAKLSASDGVAHGNSVSISGDTVVLVGVCRGGASQGEAYMFAEPGSGWTNMTQTTKLITSADPPNFSFGNSIAVSGNTVVISAYAGGGYRGAAYVFGTTAATPTIASEIVGDGQPGFWSSAPTTWTTGIGLDGRSLVSSTANGSRQSMAAWWFSMPAGVYDIAITYTPGSNRTKNLGLDLYDGVGNWIGQVQVDEQEAPSDFADQGVRWKRLGSFKITSNVFHISTWNNSADGAISIDAIELRAAPIVNDSDTAGIAAAGTFSTTGNWVSDPSGAFGDCHVLGNGPAADRPTASWTMPVAPGAYEVAVTWPSSSILATNVTYTIFDGATALGSVTVNQRTAPGDFADDGIAWKSLGSYVVTGGRLRVTLSTTGHDGQVCADAMLVLPAYQPAPIVNNGGPGSWSNASWTPHAQGLYGDSLVSSTDNGSKPSQAAWSFPVRPGSYQVWATWQPGDNLSQTVGYDVYDSLSWTSQAVVNQRIAPTDVSDQGVGWKLLGTFSVASNVLHVSTWNSPADGAICADGIRIVPVGT